MTAPLIDLLNAAHPDDVVSLEVLTRALITAGFGCIDPLPFDLVEILATPGDAYEKRLDEATARGLFYGTAMHPDPRLGRLRVAQHQMIRMGATKYGKARMNLLRPRRDSRLKPSLPWESFEHADVADHLNAHDGIGSWLHIPNERASKRENALLKLLGVSPGVPDIMVFDRPPAAPWLRGVAIEMKKRRATASDYKDTQRAWAARLRAQGWLVALCKGAAPANALIDVLFGARVIP